MQVTLEKSSGLERRMKITVPSDQVETRVEEKVRQTASRASIKGFRPGKVPLKEVRRRFGEGIRQEVGSELIQTSLNEAIVSEKVEPAGMPSIEELTLDAGKDLEFTAVFEVFPEVQLADASQIKVERTVAEVTDSDIDKMIETLREQRKVFEAVDRSAQDGDQVNIDFEGFVNEVPFEGGKAEGVDLVLGSGSMIPGFEEGLAGLKAGEEKDMPVTFPADYGNEDLKGKDAVFRIKMNVVKSPGLPELDEEFFKQFGVNEGGMDDFRAEVRKNMEKELDNAKKSRIRNQVTEGLVRINEIEVPKALVKEEIDRMKHEAIHQFGGHDKVDANMLPDEMFEPRADKSVKLGLIMRAIIDEEKIEVDDERVSKTLEDMAASYQDPEQLINWYKSNEEQMSRIRSMVLEEQVIDSIVAKASVSEVTMPYDEAIKVPQPSEGSSDEDAVDEPESVEEKPQE